ncbi:DUF1003 domain-containing protein [Mucilaginibacter aquariorum]|uniref:DUF1003 domain-containing protein n=1 Tax=Mucilaginibacter aquariorum TaxID=2967225 RepID=A0ABT1T944_9SPHI|nr:DUF1003 domain-containing protein [Mucilaginibacter aquariorum]MCQ6961069.1 DUF1003 domain-containing protein [Mucilaginibacter aquariorum]
MKKNKFAELLENEDEHIRKLHKIVLESIKEEELIANKIYVSGERLTIADRLADRVAEFGGSWKFIIFFLLAMLVWISVNVALLREKPFDPYPFILLNLILSCIAALQAPIIMMSQNRKETKDRKRAENDYLINLKAEIEIRNLHQKIDLLIVEQMKNLFEIQRAQMDIMEEINRKLPSKTMIKMKSSDKNVDVKKNTH